jgi:tetratricopeptide (TPR) repeat protein
MRCTHCGGLLSTPGAACPRCAGARAPEKPAPTPRPAEDFAAALAGANLLRMRGRWNDAADRCVEVLRADPTSAAAHSLLGDIYQDQGRPEEARHWYQLALELNPQSEADRSKLLRTEEALEAREQRAQWSAVIEGRTQPLATSLLVRESLQRIGAIAGAALCGIILVMATLVSVQERHGTADEFQLPLPSRRTATAIRPDTARERVLLAKTVEIIRRQGAAQPLRVEVDPLTQSISIRIFIPRRARENLNSTRFRELVMREGYRWAWSLRQAAGQVHESEDATRIIRVEVLSPAVTSLKEDEPDLTLSGFLSRTDLVVDPGVVTPDELSTFFSREVAPYWSAALRTQ